MPLARAFRDDVSAISWMFNVKSYDLKTVEFLDLKNGLNGPTDANFATLAILTTWPSEARRYRKWKPYTRPFIMFHRKASKPFVENVIVNWK